MAGAPAEMVKLGTVLPLYSASGRHVFSFPEPISGGPLKGGIRKRQAVRRWVLKTQDINLLSSAKGKVRPMKERVDLPSVGPMGLRVK